MTFCLLCLCLATPAPADDPPSSEAPEAVKTYLLPDNPNRPVLVLDYQGGFTPLRLAKTPTMTLFADGRVEIPAIFQGKKAFSGRITEAQLQGLLAFAIGENNFFDYDEELVKQKLSQQQGPQIRIADAPTTVIRITADGRTKEVRRYALGMMSKIHELQQLNAIRRKLEQTRSIVQIGGYAAAENWVKKANAKLKESHPTVAALELDHLQSAGERADGRLYVSLSRVTPGKEGQPPLATTSVFVSRTAAGDEQIRVSHRGQ